MKIPTLEQTDELIAEAAARNPGPWERHSWFAGRAAQAIAAHVPGMDPEAAFILGRLHDIGRGRGVTDMRHVLDGYTLLSEMGYSDAARISLTHSFPIQQLNAVAGKWDCSPAELEFTRAALADCEFDLYDRLIQLCDSIALPSGLCLIEKRLMDVALRHGVNEHSVPRWKAYLAIQQHFESLMGLSIYQVLPGVVENTFGFNPCADFKR